MDVYDPRKLKTLEDDTVKLKLLTKYGLDNAILKDINSRRW